MITTPVTSNANKAGKYYYETQEHNAEWGGKLAEILGIDIGTNCTQDQFQAMLLGYDPKDLKTPLFKNAGDPLRRAGSDYTFTMGKNASILATFDPRIVEAFKESVVETLKIAEERYSATRTRDGEGRHIEKTGNMLYTLFLHYASRSGDPAMHFHTFIHNITKGINGSLKSFEYKDLFANKAYLGAVQENKFAQKLLKLGYKIDPDRSKAMVDIKLAGELEKLKSLFSTRQAEIDIKAKELAKKYPSMTEKDLRQLAEIATRQKKEKKQQDQRASKKDIKETLKKVKKIAAEAAEEEDPDDNNSRNE